MEEASITPDEVDHINMHGTSTGLGDIAEVRAIKSVFGDHAANLSLNATKSLIGHLLGGSGAVGAACAVQSVYTDTIHPTINIFNQDPLCDVDIVQKIEKKTVNRAMCNAFGFGGHNTSLIFGKYEQ